VGKVLIAFDTNHIHTYVFGTDTLKEIRGASSLLARLNLDVMKDQADRPEIHADLIFTNGGAGLFRVDSNEQAETFGKRVQGEYRKVTGGGSSITCAIQPLPKDAPDDLKELMNFKMPDIFALMRYRLREQKDCPPDIIAHPTHPFIYLCDSCGVEYAGKVAQDEDLLLCESCKNKREEDWRVKNSLDDYLRFPSDTALFHAKSPLWSDVIEHLQHLKYEFPKGVDRPQDFNMFSDFTGVRDYIALIYADGNNMGWHIEQLKTLEEMKTFAIEVDSAVKKAVSIAIDRHLPVVTATRTGIPLFPFDILLLGGDDIVMVTSASVALDVAQTIADQFHECTEGKYTLSVGVVLTPIKYPFGLSQTLSQSTLQFAKTEGAKRKPVAVDKDRVGVSMINFMTVLGNVGRDFKDVYALLKSQENKNDRSKPNFYATLRPYDTRQLEVLLKGIRGGHRRNLGRTKLHQLREAILEMNLTTSLSDARALLRNWKENQRDFVIDCLYEFANLYQQQRFNADDPSSLSYERPFPWFGDGKDDHERKSYRTPLLDFVELYDFVTEEEANGGDQD